MFPIEHYIRVRQSNLVDKVANRPLLALCDERARLSGSPRRSYWWQQPSIMELQEANVEVD